MLKCLAPFVPVNFVLLLAARTSYSPEPQVAKEPTAAKSSIDVKRDAIAWQDVEGEEADNSPAGMSVLAPSILERVSEPVGTPHHFGGAAAKGFGCNDLVGYLLCEEAGIKLPRPIRELVDMDVSLVFGDELQPGDLSFFNNRGRGRVNHVGIYIGNDQFIYSANRRGGGVRVDSLDSSYWSLSYTGAKRVFEPGYKDILTNKR